jgi:hypothetical protein
MTSWSTIVATGTEDDGARGRRGKQCCRLTVRPVMASQVVTMASSLVRWWLDVDGRGAGDRSVRQWRRRGDWLLLRTNAEKGGRSGGGFGEAQGKRWLRRLLYHGG